MIIKRMKMLKLLLNIWRRWNYR